MDILRLTQIQELHKLGIKMADAGLVVIFSDEEGCEVPIDSVFQRGECYYCNVDGEDVEVFREVHDAENGNYDHSYREECGAYTLAEVWDKLPSKFKVDNLEYKLVIDNEKREIRYENVYTQSSYNAPWGHEIRKLDAFYMMMKIVYSILVY